MFQDEVNTFSPTLHFHRKFGHRVPPWRLAPLKEPLCLSQHAVLEPIAQIIESIPEGASDLLCVPSLFLGHQRDLSLSPLGAVDIFSL